MGTTFRLLAIDDEADVVRRWFRALREAPEEVATEKGAVFYFRALGALDHDPHASPIVTYFAPRKVRGSLWTAGEVHFLATPLRARFPALAAIARQFGKWLATHDLVFSRRTQPARDFNFWLEGSLRNFDPEIRALPKALAALERGQYFVADSDGDAVLDRVCHVLRLRGVPCTSS